VGKERDLTQSLGLGVSHREQYCAAIMQANC